MHKVKWDRMRSEAEHRKSELEGLTEEVENTKRARKERKRQHLDMVLKDINGKQE